MDWRTMDPAIVWIALALLGALVVVALLAAALRSKRTADLRARFGPEYDRLSSKQKRREVESELRDRERNVGELDIHPLPPAERSRLRADWLRTQARFIERPTTAVVEAEEVIAEAMQLRGYPPADFERRAADLSVHYPRLVGDYREAHRLLESNRNGASSTEDLRRAMILQKRLFDELMGGGTDDVVTDVSVEREPLREPPPKVDERDKPRA